MWAEIYSGVLWAWRTGAGDGSFGGEGGGGGRGGYVLGVIK